MNGRCSSPSLNAGLRGSVQSSPKNIWSPIHRGLSCPIMYVARRPLLFTQIIHPTCLILSCIKRLRSSGNYSSQIDKKPMLPVAPGHYRSCLLYVLVLRNAFSFFQQKHTQRFPMPVPNWHPLPLACCTLSMPAEATLKAMVFTLASITRHSQSRNCPINQAGPQLVCSSSLLFP